MTALKYLVHRLKGPLGSLLLEPSHSIGSGALSAVKGIHLPLRCTFTVPRLWLAACSEVACCAFLTCRNGKTVLHAV